MTDTTDGRVPSEPGFDPSREDEIDFDDYDYGCYECGGEGFVSDCFEEWACLDPEYGCDLCTRRCSLCNPRRRDSDGSPEGGDGEAGSVEDDSAGRQASPEGGRS